MRARILADNALDAALHARWTDRGWRSAAPAPARAATGQARFDQLRYVLGDIASGLGKKAIR